MRALNLDVSLYFGLPSRTRVWQLLTGSQVPPSVFDEKSQFVEWQSCDQLLVELPSWVHSSQ